PITFLPKTRELICVNTSDLHGTRGIRPRQRVSAPAYVDCYPRNPDTRDVGATELGVNPDERRHNFDSEVPAAGPTRASADRAGARRVSNGDSSHGRASPKGCRYPVSSPFG